MKYKIKTVFNVFVPNKKDGFILYIKHFCHSYEVYYTAETNIQTARAHV